MNARAPIAVTGIGMVTAQGAGLEATWEGVVAMRDRLAAWARAPAGPLAGLKVAACPEVPRPGDLPGRLWKRLGRTQQLAAVCADEALDAAGLPRDLAGLRGPAGLFMATTVCGMDQTEQFYEQYRCAPASAEARLMTHLETWELVNFLGRRHGVAGPRQLCMTTCVGSAMAIGAACDFLRTGGGPVALAGGAEALCRVVLSGFHALKLVAAEGCRPFDRNRPGITVGEGAAVLVLETLEHAQGRGARILGLIRGFAATCDAFHITAPEPKAAQAVRAIGLALQEAGLRPEEIDYVNAHGTGTRENDATESVALRAAFGERVPPVSSTKRLTGHTFGAAGAIEAALCLQALRCGVLPANGGSVEPETELRLPLVRETQPAALRAALSCNFAFGGNNTALVLGRAPGTGRG